MEPYVHTICALCSKVYTDPRILSCLHSFCLQCLYKEMGKNEEFQCPTCNQNVSIPVGGASVLPQNFHLAFESETARYVSKIVSNDEVCCDHCIDGSSGPAVVFCCTCRQFLCNFCHKYHKRGRQQSKHSMVGLDEEGAKQIQAAMKPLQQLCSSHNLVLDVYCTSCKFLICPKCILFDHKDHMWIDYLNVAMSQREEMKVALNTSKEVGARLNEAIDENSKIVEQLEISKRNSHLTIDQTFEMLEQILKKRKLALFAELETVSLSKTTSLTLQKEQFKKTLKDIDHYTGIVSHILTTHTDQEVVGIGGLVLNELQATLKKVDDVFLAPIQRSDTCLSVSLQTDDLLREMSNFGNILEVSTSCIPVSSLTSLSTAVVRKRLHAKVTTKTSDGKISHVKAELRVKSAVISGEVEDNLDGTYTVALTPQTAGPQQLHITVNGQHVQSSPHDLVVRPKRDYKTLCKCSYQQAIKCIMPLCVAIHETGHIYVGSDVNKGIYVFDQSGDLKRTICSGGSGDGQFGRPTAIALKGDVLYVADQFNNCIQKLTTEGEFLLKFATFGERRASNLEQPVAIVINSSGQLIVSDFKNHQILVLNENGVCLLTIDGNCTGNNAFQNPWGLALDPQGNIHVSAYGSDTVKVFTSGGVYIKMYGALKGPSGLAIDDEGYSIVSEGKGNSLSIFDPQGNKCHTVNNLSNPFCVFLDHTNSSLYIADHDGDAVLKYCMYWTV